MYTRRKYFVSQVSYEGTLLRNVEHSYMQRKCKDESFKAKDATLQIHR